MESHPAALVRFAVNVPAAMIDWPFQSNGNADWHTVVSVELVATGFTITLSVATESHPAALVRFAVSVPAAVIDWPFQVIGNAD